MIPNRVRKIRRFQTNTDKRSYLQSEQDKVTANALKISFDVVSSAQVGTNALKVTFDKLSEVTDNSAKRDDAAQDLLFAGKIGTTGSQAIANDGTSHVLQLRNNTADQLIFQCWGADGQTQVLGGNVINFTRPSLSYIRAPDASASFRISTRGVSKIECSDRVTIPAQLVCSAQEVDFTNLPSVNPLVAGRLYKDANGFVRISSG